jgi:hypothetical protein
MIGVATRRPARLVNARALISSLLSIGCIAFAGAAQADVIYEENFASGLGRFTSSGSVTTGSYGARIRGAFGSGDGVMTSSAINTAGYTSLSLSFTRSASGLDLGESGIASVSINGGAFTTLESLRAPSGRITFQLGSTAQSVTLRFAVNASSSLEYYDVSAIVLECAPTPSAASTSTTPRYRSGYRSMELGACSQCGQRVQTRSNIAAFRQHHAE